MKYVLGARITERNYIVAVRPDDSGFSPAAFLVAETCGRLAEREARRRACCLEEGAQPSLGGDGGRTHAGVRLTCSHRHVSMERGMREDEQQRAKWVERYAADLAGVPFVRELVFPNPQHLRKVMRTASDLLMQEVLASFSLVGRRQVGAGLLDRFGPPGAVKPSPVHVSRCRSMWAVISSLSTPAFIGSSSGGRTCTRRALYGFPRSSQ